MEYDDLKGTGVALVTPFNKDRGVDYVSLTKLVKHLVTGKVDYLVALGTTAETATLTKEEKNNVIDTVIKAADNKLPVVLGLGGNNTQEILGAFKDKHNQKGIRAFLSVSPYYNKPNQRGIYEHYKTIAKASPLPVILYNVPGRTASNITSETTLRLAHDFKNIIGIKEASGNLEQCMKIIKHKPKNFLVISGDDMLTLPMIAAGAEGVISVVANAFPKDFSEMVREIRKGKVKEAQRLHYKLTDITEQLFADGNPAGIKAALEIMGICKAHLRLPLVNVNDETRKALEKLIKNY